MLALTLWQPWAHVVAAGIKLVENRPWSPPASLLFERFAIHAGQRWDEDGAATIEALGGPSLGRGDVVFGALIATARLSAVVYNEKGAASCAGRDQARWFFGPVGWVLDHVRPLPTPLPCRGFQKLWRVPSGLELP